MAMDRVEIITSVERRRRWSAAEKARLVEAMAEPGAVVTEIARRAEVNASLLYRWRRELRGGRGTPTFVPVRVAPALDETAVATALPSVSPPTLAPTSSITIAFGGEVRVEIEGAPDAATLANVIGAVMARNRR